MIVPMKKVSLIILGDKKEDTLKKLRKLGLVHIEISEGSGEKISELQANVTLLENSIFSLSEKLEKNTVFKEATVEKALEISKRTAYLFEKLKSYKAEEVVLQAELDRLKVWGEVDPDELLALKEKGVEISLNEMPTSDYLKLPEEIKTVVFSKNKNTVNFLSIGNDKDDVLKKYRVEMPSKSTLEIKERLDYLHNRKKFREDELLSCSSYVNAMKSAVQELKKEIQFETYKVGMNDESLAKNENGEFTVSHFMGFIEAENVEKLKDEAKANSWGLLIEEPTPEDNVPTKLKNNKFVSLIYPLTDFLGTVPGYFEFDVSGWFLGFILIFFGIIFGDGGYGILVTGIAAIPIIKAMVSKKKVQPAFLLIGLFGIATILWGLLTCTWFGLPAASLPSWLQKLSIPYISNVYADKLWHPFWTSGEVGLTTSQNLQIFCFTLALIQLSVAHALCAARNRKSLKVLGDIGAIFELIGIFYIVLSLVVNSAVFSFGLVISGIPVGTVAIAFIAVGFIMNFVFSNYDGSIGKSVLTSLKNIVSVLLGVVNVFSDIVSYIRLWAVGLAGAAISSTVNDLVGPFFGNFMFMIFAIILLVFGHGLNMILNVLSVIVHGIRLNTLEFSSHLDMSWVGHKYEPFKE